MEAAFDEEESNAAPGNSFPGQFGETENDKIHPALQITKGQTLSLTLAFYLRHNLTKTALHDLLCLLNNVVPHCVPTSKYFKERYFIYENSKTEMHFYCPKCQTYLGTKTDSPFECPICVDSTVITAKMCIKQEDYFLVHPIKDQLAFFFENRNLYKILEAQKRKLLDPTKKGEVFTGDRYNNSDVKDFLNESPYNFTMTFSSDGIKPLKASSLSLWPITCSINELETHQKSKFLTLCCLYSGNNKPPPETILKPFVEQTISLFENGFDWHDSSGKKNNSKVMFCLCVADALARAMFCNLVQFNGAYGCGLCLHEGSRARQGKGTVQVYDVIHPLPSLKNQESMIEHAFQAI